MAKPKSVVKGGGCAAVAKTIEATFKKHAVKLTMGGEPTYVPFEPEGAEWSITALGPTKLKYAYAFADALIAQAVPNAVAVLSPGKFYPGEVNPRWALHLVWNRNGSPLVPALTAPAVTTKPVTAAAFHRLKRTIGAALGKQTRWLRGIDPLDASRLIAVLPIDHNGKKFVLANWKLGASITLLAAEGAAGLRLPLDNVPPEISRRALTLEVIDGALHVFLAPLLQAPLLALMDSIALALHELQLGAAVWSGYVPPDEAGRWEKLALAADPGVLEINLPPCATWRAYSRWMKTLERAAHTAGMRSFKRRSPEDEGGTGGGNHLLFGGPSLDRNPLFTHPRWVTSMLRYWQHHPSLAYLFTGVYVGPSSQAPRPDECVTSLYDLEMAYQFLEQLPPGDHRYLISETLRHLHTDSSGNTHRSECSFDKFWNVNFDGGCRGLVEFRAVESLPHAEWMSAIALLWQALAAYLLDRPFTHPLVAHGEKLHDWFFLPAGLWSDFSKVLADLDRAGFHLPAGLYRAIMDWRFPVMLDYAEAGATLTVRKAHEGWPLLCEQPLEGGNTSRFVDTSIERLEFTANAAFAGKCELFVQGRRLALERLPSRQFGVGLRYRRTALFPSLHPGIPPQMPLLLTIRRGGTTNVFKLEQERRKFVPTDDPAPTRARHPCRKLQPELLTCDLRIP